MKTKPIFRIILYIVLIVALYMPEFAYAAPDTGRTTENGNNMVTPVIPTTKAASVLLADVERGQLLYGKEINTKLHIAALCKLMTILTAIENGDINSVVTVSKNSLADAQGSALNLEAGDKYQLKDLLEAIMLVSANDAANAVAEHIAKDVTSFVKKMNETAYKLGMKNTRFMNPTGLYDEFQYTTANDIAIFIKYAVKNEVFNDIFGVQIKPWFSMDGSSKILTSSNELFWSMNNILGGKTGYNTKDKQSVISVAASSGMKLVCIVLDSPGDAMFTDAEALFNYGFTNYMRSRLVQKGEEIKRVIVDKKEVVLISGTDEYYVHPVGSSYIKNIVVTTDVKPPILTSKLSGNASYILEDDTVITVGLYPATQPTPPPDDFMTAAKKKLLQNRDILYLLVVLLVVEVLLLIKNIFKFFAWVFRKIFRRSSRQATRPQR